MMLNETENASAPAAYYRLLKDGIHHSALLDLNGDFIVEMDKARALRFAEMKQEELKVIADHNLRNEVMKNLAYIPDHYVG